jgi:hypothetical protein
MADSNTNTEQQTHIEVILRQTDYTFEQAREKLLEHNNDYMAVIRSYLKQGLTSTTPMAKPLSMNQQIYKEIRSFMDEADLTQAKPSQ